MSILRELRPDQVAAIDRLADGLMLKWRTALAFENSLNENMPTLHRLLEAARSRIVMRVSELMLSSHQPWTQLATAESTAHALLEPDFGQLYGTLVGDVASGEIARLIGECPIGWKSRGWRMPTESNVSILSELLSTSIASPYAKPERLAPSALYDLDYRVCVICACFHSHAKSDEPGFKKINAARLKLLQFIAIRSWLLPVVKEWSESRDDPQRSVVVAILTARLSWRRDARRGH